MKIQETDISAEKALFQSVAGREKNVATRDEQGKSVKYSVKKADASGEKSAGKEAKLDRQAVDKILQEVEEKLESRNIELKFRVHEESGETQIEVTDPESDKVIRKIPGDDILKISANIKAFAGGLLDRPV